MTSGSKVSQSGLARKWGCSRQHVHNLVKRGMPLDSEEAAELWVLRNTKEGVGHKSRGVRAGDRGVTAVAQVTTQLKQHPPPPSPDPQLVGADTLDASVARVTLTEREAYSLLHDALARAGDGDLPTEERVAAVASLGALQRNHSAAVRARIETEKFVREQKKEAGLLVEADWVVGLFRDFLGPLDGMWRNFARSYGPRANPKDPALAQTVLQEGVDALNKQREAAFAKLRNLTNTSAE